MRRSIRAIAAALTVALIVPAVVLSAWPVADRHSYISQGFHKGHRADDIAAPGGTEVVPIKSGRVVFAGWKRNCGGYQVWVAHGNGLYSAYYHLRSESVGKGQSVRRSKTRLGRVGQSGCAQGSHLHVEVWRGFPWGSGSYRVNPWKHINSGTWLPYRYR
jgi:murein DD-endopeptidase MepM/ murein hydrolase activator NlpD